MNRKQFSFPSSPSADGIPGLSRETFVLILGIISLMVLTILFLLLTWLGLTKDGLRKELDKEVVKEIVKEISSEYSLEGLMLKLKLQYFGHKMQRTDSLENLMLGKIEARRRMGWQRMKWLDGITDSKGMNLSSSCSGDGQRNLAYCSPWGCKELDVTEQLNWNELWY